MCWKTSTAIKYSYYHHVRTTRVNNVHILWSICLCFTIDFSCPGDSNSSAFTNCFDIRKFLNSQKKVYFKISLRSRLKSTGTKCHQDPFGNHIFVALPMRTETICHRPFSSFTVRHKCVYVFYANHRSHRCAAVAVMAAAPTVGLNQNAKTVKETSTTKRWNEKTLPIRRSVGFCFE